MSFWREAPPPEQLVQMEPEELAPFILRYLQKQQPGSINRYNFGLVSDHDFVQLVPNGQMQQRYKECLMEAWMYLEREGFMAPQPGTQDNWMFVTRRGKKVVDDADFESYKQAYLLSSEGLDPVLLQKVKSDFVRGDYDSALFKAFKEVEVRVRKKANLPAADIGVALMRKAFNPTTGALTDPTAEPGEKQARMDLFAGAIGTYKNPSSHREVDLGDSREAADIIHFANQLLRIVDRLP